MAVKRPIQSNHFRGVPSYYVSLTDGGDFLNDFDIVHSDVVVVVVVDDDVTAS